jgi:hypothetical protein
MARSAATQASSYAATQRSRLSSLDSDDRRELAAAEVNQWGGLTTSCRSCRSPRRVQCWGSKGTG